MTGRSPFFTSAARNFAPVGLVIVPLGETVVKQMLFSMIREGYIARKSSEMTHSYNPGCRLCTHPPSICSAWPPHAFENLEGELGVVDAVANDPDPAPHLLPLDEPAQGFVVSRSEELLGHVV